MRCSTLPVEPAPEVLPDDGFGSMEEKRFRADIKGSKHNAAALMRIFRDRITEIPGPRDEVERDAHRRQDDARGEQPALQLQLVAFRMRSAVIGSSRMRAPHAA